MSDPANLSAIADYLTKTAQEPYQKYWWGLGRFIHHFSQAEARLVSLLRQETKVSNQVGGILFHSTRIDVAKDHLNKILLVTDQIERSKTLANALNQFSVIANIRNNLVHWGAHSEGLAGLVVSNEHTYPIKIKKYRINVDDLNDMTTDLVRIDITFSFEGVSEMFDDALWAEFLAKPWLYKPPQPDPRTTQRPKGPRSPKRPPRASDESQ